jgi:acetyl esterase/lipase
MFRTTLIALALATAPVLCSSVMAQESPFKRVETPAQKNAIPLYEGAAPGFEDATQEEVWTLFQGRERWIRNVTVPTLTPYLPKKSKATGAAVLVVPGGGFQFVSIDNEGYPVAEMLAEQGIAAFVLKYRVLETKPDEAEFGAMMMRQFDPSTPAEERVDLTPGIATALADARTAMTMIRERSDEWGLDPERIGMLGFSAGAMTSLNLVQAQDADAAVDFFGYIYGPMVATEVPEGAPPMFVALAADDGLFGAQGFGLVESWRQANVPVELHYYKNGAHGFGAQKLGGPSDLWFNQFMMWLKAEGVVEKK